VVQPALADGIVHRQLYTDESIRHAVALGGFTIVAEWVFGQDADDLSRFLLQNLKDKYSPRRFRRCRGNCWLFRTKCSRSWTARDLPTRGMSLRSRGDAWIFLPSRFGG
jgi:hypothetical protein